MLNDPQRIIAAAVALGACAVIGAVIGWRAVRTGTVQRRTFLGIASVFLVAVALRAGVSLIQDGGYDVWHAYFSVGSKLRSGGDIYTGDSLGLSNYPPVIYWWWALASAIDPHDGHLFAAVVRAPYWLCDAAIAPALLLLSPPAWRRRAGWCYAFNPLSIAATTLHGQFDSIPVLALLLAVAWLQRHPRASALLVGFGAAVKTWPAYFVPVILAALRGDRRRYVVLAAAVPLAAFITYAVIHPSHLLQGILGVLIYTPHRQGLGTSRFFPEGWGSAIVPFTNVLLLALVVRIAWHCARRDDIAAADAVALSMVLVLGLSASVSDQYVMWPFALLLLRGRLRMATLLAAAVTPAIVTIDLHSASANSNPLDLPTWLMLSGTIPFWIVARLLWVRTFGTAVRRQTGLPVPTSVPPQMSS